MGFDDVRPGIEVKAPHLFQQHLPRDQPAFAAHKHFEQTEFARLQIDDRAPAAHGAGDKVHLEVAGREHSRRAPEGRTARQRLQARKEFLKGERLDQIVVAARPKSLDTIVDAGQIGEKQDRYRDSLRTEEGDDGKPSIPGNMRSRTMTSNVSAAAVSKPWRPFAAILVACPRACKPVATKSAVSESSSMIRIFMCVSSQERMP